MKDNDKKQLLKVKSEFDGRGYDIPKGVKFYKVTSSRKSKYTDMIGMKVGEFTHSCHIDTTDFIVLLFVDLGGVFVEHFDGLALEELK